MISFFDTSKDSGKTSINDETLEEMIQGLDERLSERDDKLTKRIEKMMKKMEEMDAKRLEFEGYINNSMREVADTLVDVMNHVEYSKNDTNFKKPRYFNQ